MSQPGDIVNDVLIGKDNWLFLWQGAKSQFDYLTNVKSPSKDSAHSFITNLEMRRKLCASKNIRYLHVVYPSKPVIMNKYLPQEICKNVKSLFERHYAGSLTGGVKVLYPRELMIEPRVIDQMFSRQDTHMTALGTAIVAGEILRSFGHEHDINAHMKSEMHLRNGDLAIMLKIKSQFPEVFHIIRRRSDTIFSNRPFLPGNTGTIRIAHNVHAASSLRLLAIGDSFLNQGLTALSTFYRDILFVRSEQFQPELLDLFGPDDVVTSNAERYLSNVQSDATGESVLMSGYGRIDYAPAASFTAALKAQLSKLNYPKVYDKWSNQIAAITFENLGVAQLNTHLRHICGAPGSLESTGRDPQLIFFNVSLEAQRDYRLRILMESSVAGTAQLFLGRRDAPFSEEFSVRKPVQVGMNEFYFELPAESRGRHLRFDPLNVLGQLRIAVMELLPASPTSCE